MENVDVFIVRPSTKIHEVTFVKKALSYLRVHLRNC
jgi:hypothetical protein